MFESRLIRKASLAVLVLLLGSGAAHANDSFDLESQIIPEPQADAEQVRSCEAAGPGFKYIPGTETCIRISGHVRYEININSRD